MIPQVQGSKEWLKWRKTRIGASDSAAILGISPYKTAYRLWEEKMGFKDPDPINEYMQKGIDLEPKAREHLCFMTSSKFEPIVCVHPQYHWMIASFDGFCEETQIGAEIKCNGPKNHALAKEGKVPDYYYSQLQHQMAVKSLSFIWYLSYVEDHNDCELFEVQRDDKFIENLIQKEKEFFNYIENDIPYPSKYRKVDDPDGIKIIAQLKDVISQLKWLEGCKEDLKNQLINMYEGENCEGEGIKLSKIVSKGRIIYDDIPELKGIDLEPYRSKPTQFWKITQEKEKSSGS